MIEETTGDIETEITISEGKVIEISLDEWILDNHVGDTPIDGIVITPEIMQHIMNATMKSSMCEINGMKGGHRNDLRSNETGTVTTEDWQ